jgi:predicted adenine nucleotide alpha hydrolase (AANH) superfamily ATPase
VSAGGILLHACCGPCAAHPLKSLLLRGRPVHLLFYNPNIQPPWEYRRRRDSLAFLGVAYEGLYGWPGSVTMSFPDYGPMEFLRALGDRALTAGRCALCYRLRLGRAAAEAKALGLREFSSTLLSSAQQAHGLIREEAGRAAGEHGVGFHYEDFREGRKEGLKAARGLGLYLQSYCGCLFGCSGAETAGKGERA